LHKNLAPQAIQRIFTTLKLIKNNKIMQNLKSFTKNYKPFYFFNTESKLNLLDKSQSIKINDKTYYKIK
jgi:hypothetical protein